MTGQRLYGYPMHQWVEKYPLGHGLKCCICGQESVIEALALHNGTCTNMVGMRFDALPPDLKKHVHRERAQP